MEQQQPDIIVIDDLMQKVASDEAMVDLFTEQSHHMRMSVFFIVQNFFHQSKLMITIFPNAYSSEGGYFDTPWIDTIPQILIEFAGTGGC